MTRKQARAIWASQNGICALCARDVSEFENYEIDHGHALGLGGPDTPGNLFMVHKACHTEKTAVDLRMIASAVRSAEKKARHDDAMVARQGRAPNARERRLAKWRARDRELRTTERQE